MNTERTIRKSLFPTEAQRAGRAFRPPILDGEIAAETPRPEPVPENRAHLRPDSLYRLWNVTVCAEHFRKRSKDRTQTLELEFQNPTDEVSARAAAMKACTVEEGYTLRIVGAQPASHSRVERVLRPFAYPQNNRQGKAAR